MEGRPATDRAEAVPPMHWPALDGMRAIAVLLVLYNHAPMVLWDGEATGFWHGSMGAWLGVDLFFVLSGFLITSILLQGRGRPGAFRRFWLRRALRIFPLAYAYLLALATCAWLLPRMEHLRDGAAFGWASIYLLNYHVAWHGWPPAAFSLLWSLAVEEHFYLAWPLVALKARLRVVVIVLVATIVGAPVLRAIELPTLGPIGVYVTTHCRCDTLAYGALLAVAWRSAAREALRRLAGWLALPAFAFVAWVVATPVSAVAADTATWFHVVGYSAIAASFTVWCTVAIAPPRWLLRVLGGPVLARIGRISYGLYVWHVLTAELTVRALAWLRIDAGRPWLAAVWLAALFATATASYRWLEAPLLRLKDRLG